MLTLALALTALTSHVASAFDFDQRFTGRTLRFDYEHAGSATEEHVCLDRIRLEGAWPGSRTQLLDPTNLGKYRVSVLDLANGAEIYSRGFASIYGEWETTGEAKQIWRSFHESVRFPEPRAPVQLRLEKRGDDGAFRELFATTIEPPSPTGRFVDRSPLAARGTSVVLFENGDPATKVDLLVLSDGYTAAQQAEFQADLERLTGALFRTEPFARRKGDFNARALFLPTAEPGISNPRRGEWRAGELGLSFNAFDSDRYVLTYENERLREVAAQLPYDALILLFRSRKYGGGGIFNLWATCASDTAPAEYVFVHEFGHSFAGLADEYYSSPVAYEEFVAPGVEPWEPNVTALLDPARLKWRHLVTPGTPLPTPWSKDVYDEVDLAYQARRAALLARQGGDEEVESLFDEVKRASKQILGASENAAAVGAFEGAAYEPTGLYRPAVDCIMFTRNPTSFCAVCEEAIDRVIELYAR